MPDRGEPSFWTVVSERQIVNGRSAYRCRCVCGVERIVLGQSLKSGASRSCGCQMGSLGGAKREKHGSARKSTGCTKEYRAWSDMRQRCLNPDHASYRHYGGRGIAVCDRWNGPDGFATFLADMGHAPDRGMTLERMDNDAGYSPENCCWATRTRQNRNKRALGDVPKKVPVRLSLEAVKEIRQHGGSVREFVTKFGVSPSYFYQIKKGSRRKEL